MLTGQPLFPGDSDLDQIYHVVRFFGKSFTLTYVLSHYVYAHKGVGLISELHMKIQSLHQKKYVKAISGILDIHINLENMKFVISCFPN